MIKEIYDEVVSIMNTMKGANQPFVDVYGYNQPKQDTFPFANVILSEGNVQEDQSSNLKTLNSTISIICGFQQENTMQASIQRITVLDLVLEKFTDDGIANYLNNKVYQMDLNYELFETTDSEQPIFGFIINLDCKNTMSITT
jgi:hypothetical protein